VLAAFLTADPYYAAPAKREPKAISSVVDTDSDVPMRPG
jgi:hypothetical protein